MSKNEKKMSDLDMFKAMLNRAKIEFKEESDSESTTITVYGGYWDFYSSICFEAKTGTLLSVTAWG